MARIKTGGPPQKKAKLDPRAVAKALASRPQGIDSGMLLVRLVECWGGVDQFARDIYAEYQAADEGSMVRQRILEMINRLTVVVTSQEIAKPRNAADMDDDELEAAATKLLGRMADGPAAAAGAEEAGPPA